MGTEEEMVNGYELQNEEATEITEKVEEVSEEENLPEVVDE